jgi:PAS domain S-box-containing protein
MAIVPSEAQATKKRNKSTPGTFRMRQPRIEELLKSAPAAIAFLSGPELRCSYVNEMAVRATGRPAADHLLGRTFREALPELDGTGIFDILDGVVATGRTFHGSEVKMAFLQFESGKLKDKYFDFVCQAMLNSAGELDGIFIHAVDLTDRVESRRALEASRERLSLAHEAAQMGTWEWDGVANKRALSPELHHMFGTDASMDEDVIVNLWASRVHPEDQAHVRRQMEDSSLTGALEIEYRYLHPARGERVFYSKGRRMAGSSQLAGVVLDLTEMKTAESAVREQRERFEFAAEAGDIGYWFCDLPFDKLEWDRRVKEHFWLAGDAEVDINLFYARLHPDDRESTRVAIEHSIKNHASYDVEYRTVSDDGKQKWIRAAGRTAYDAEGRAIRFDGVTQNVTALKQTREALIRSEKLAVVGRLAATISHEINNPLEAVTNLLFLMKENTQEEAVKAFGEVAQQELERVSHIVTHTLRFNRQTHVAVREKMSALLESSTAIYQGRMKDAGIEILRDFRDTEPVRCFGSELRQVFANLIGNSFDASKRGGRLLLRTRDARHPTTGERGVRVTIADSGAGMDAATRQRLFEPFFTTKGDNGTGLGLWVSNEILKKHRASVDVRSKKSIPSGTTFSIWLPLEPLLAPEI